MAFTFNAGWSRTNTTNIGIARISNLNMLYSLQSDQRCGYLSIPSVDNNSHHEIFKRESSHDQQEYFSLIHQTMFLGPDWRHVVKWYFDNNIDQYTTNEEEGSQMRYDDIVFHTSAYEICYQGISCDYLPSEIHLNNQKDVYLMIKQFLVAFKEHLSEPRINAYMYQYRLSLLPDIAETLKYSLFIEANPVYSDCFDFFVNNNQLDNLVESKPITSDSLSFDLLNILIYGFCRGYISDDILQITVQISQYYLICTKRETSPSISGISLYTF